jgi:hypothetical protein
MHSSIQIMITGPVFFCIFFREQEYSFPFNNELNLILRERRILWHCPMFRSMLKFYTLHFFVYFDGICYFISSMVMKLEYTTMVLVTELSKGQVTIH